MGLFKIALPFISLIDMCLQKNDFMLLMLIRWSRNTSSIRIMPGIIKSMIFQRFIVSDLFQIMRFPLIFFGNLGAILLANSNFLLNWMNGSSLFFLRFFPSCKVFDWLLYFTFNRHLTLFHSFLGDNLKWQVVFNPVSIYDINPISEPE